MKTAVDDCTSGQGEPNLSASSIPSSRWSFSPLQAIPRNADALWSLVDSVYFASLPAGHEVIDCLKVLAVSSGSAAGAEQLPPSSSRVRLEYKIESVQSDEMKKVVDSALKLEFLLDTGLSTGVLSSNVLLPPVPAPSRRLLKGKESTIGENGALPKWKLVEASSREEDSSMQSAESVELAYLEAELARVQALRQQYARRVLEKIEGEQRPSKKAWFEAEQNLLSLYERKPPSSFQQTAASFSGSGSIEKVPLSKLGKVDSSLPDSFKDAELCCSVCGEGDTTDDNDILICDGCSFSAHQSCYFVKDIPDGHWFCQLCSTVGSSKKAATLAASTTCVLCLQSASFEGGGLMKPVVGGSWAHVKCAVWVPEAAFPADGTSISVICNQERENLRCSICKLKGGAPLQCAFGKCTTAFHVSCAARVGLLPEEKSLKNLYCARHIKIQLQTSPCISRLMSVRKQDLYLKLVNDKVVAPKIGGYISASYSGKTDGIQSFLLQIAGVHPLVVAGVKGVNYVAQNDLMDANATDEDLTGVPLIQEFKDLVELADSTSKNINLFSVDLGCCSECMRPLTDSPSLAYKCESCGLFCHWLCRDRPGVPVPNVDDLNSEDLGKILKWKSKTPTHPVSRNPSCKRCESINASGSSQIALAHTYCVLCMQIGGLVMPLQAADLDDDDSTNHTGEDNGFVHPRCLWWMLASSMVSLHAPPSMQIKSISSSYHFHACAVCGSRLGCTVKCGRVGCSKRFHVSCGFHAGCFFTVRTSSGLVAGTRDDADDELSVLDNLASVINGNVPFRRVITCWSHEQRGMRRVAPQLGRAFPHRVERIRWVPPGIRPELISVVNQVLSGELPISQHEPSVEKKLSLADEASTVRRKRRKKEDKAKIVQATVRFVDGLEVTCQDEDWEGGCAMCGKAWTDSKGQILESICCDKCDQWFHFACVGISKAPSGEFICPNCL